MKLNSSKTFFLSFMMIGVIMSLSSNNWIMIWCGLEITMVSFLPIMASKLSMSPESSMKYFLIQSISSSMLIFGLMMTLNGVSVMGMIMTTSILIKMGVAPFHSWVISIIEGLNFDSSLILLTIMKVAPILMISYFKSSLTMIILMSMLIGSISGLNQSSTRKIMIYSSIFNLGLILMMLKNSSSWTMFFILYSMMIFMVISTFKTNKMNYLNQIFMNNKKITSKLNIWFLMMSLGGMPPMLGFSMKLIVIETMILELIYMLMFVMITTSLLVMMFYTRMMFMYMMLSSSINKMMIKNSMLMSTKILIVNLTSLPVLLTMKSLL